MAPRWLTVQMVAAMHAEALADFGGAPGIRDAGLLERALARPRNLHNYADKPTDFALAAAYCAGIVKNHPFLDGNKRTGLLAAAAFLALNGHDFQPDEADTVTVILALAAGERDEGMLARWFAANCVRKSR
jgi:death-on-curing protein